MWKPWLWSSLAGGMVVGFITGTYSVLSLYGVFFVAMLFLMPLVSIAASVLGSVTQRRILQNRFGLSLSDLPQSIWGWMIIHALAWTVLFHGIGFISFAAWIAYQRSPFYALHMTLMYVVVGTIVGLVLGGIQLLFWRRQLRPQLLWLGLSWVSWVASALLVAAGLNLPYEIGILRGQPLPALVNLFCVSLGLSIAWFMQSAIAGGCFVRGLGDEEMRER